MPDQSIGEQQAENKLDDYQSIDLDINSLLAKYIGPIDRYRSRNVPVSNSGSYGSYSIGKQQGLSSSLKPGESRAHAFYRMLGLPVVGSSGKFYNPGFNPTLATEESKRRMDIAGSIPADKKEAIWKRETSAKTRTERFSKANVESAVYSLALATPKGQRKFSNIESTPENIPKRQEFITSKYKKSDNSEITETFCLVDHILSPFMTNPAICANLDPTSGSGSVLIAAPFLSKNDTEYESNLYTKRPGLELILRLRLRQQNVLENYLLQSIIWSVEKNGVSFSSLKEIASTLTGTGVSNEDVDEILNKTGRIEIYTLNDLVKTYKGLISLYRQSVEIIERVSNQIIWTPLSNDGGPEKGTVVARGLIKPKGYLDSWGLEHQIGQLEIKSSLAKSQMDIGETNDGVQLSFGDFTISEYHNVSKSFDDDLQEKKNEFRNLEAAASNALRTIEIISGEVSGLGLIDIIAIYMALWSLDMSVLLDLIDDESITRLNEIEELQTAEVKARAAKQGNASEALEKLTKRIITILEYGDRLYERELGTPNEQEGGDIVRDG